jgi:hypothetical protein
MGIPIDLNWYYNLWLIPSGTLLFHLNLGIADIPVYSWLMSLTIYVRVLLVVVLLWRWRRQAKIRYLEQPKDRKNLFLTWWQRIFKGTK